MTSVAVELTKKLVQTDSTDPGRYEGGQWRILCRSGCRHCPA